MNRAVFFFWACLLFVLASSTGYAQNFEIAAPYGSAPARLDDVVTYRDWGNAVLSFGNTQVFIKQDGKNLYVAFNVTDIVDSSTPYNKQDLCFLRIDVAYSRLSSLQSDNLQLEVERNGAFVEDNVTAGNWALTSVSGWDAKAVSSSQSWQCVFNITYSKIGVTAGLAKDLGVLFASIHGVKDQTGTVDCWPPFDVTWETPDMVLILGNKPSTWGTLSSSVDWFPEFPSFLIIPSLLMITLLIALVASAEKHSRDFHMVREEP